MNHVSIIGSAVIDAQATSAGERRALRFRVLDLYRFIAAAGIVIYHFSAVYNPDAVLHAITAQFYLFVDFFFILSGFVIAHTYAHRVNSRTNIATFLRRRVARIYPLYALTLAIYTGSLVLRLSSHPENYNTPWILSQFAMASSWSLNATLPLNYPSWSISVEWTMYLLFPGIAFLHGRWGLWPLVVISVFAAIIVNFLLAENWMEASAFANIYNPLRAVPTFTVGIIIAVSPCKLRYGVWMGFASFVSAIIAMMGESHIYIIIVLFSLTVLLTAAGEAFERSIVFDNSVVAFLGDLSYSVYMLHPLVFSILFEHAWKHLGGDPRHTPLSYIAPAIILTLIIATAAFYWFEAPMRRILSGPRWTE
jgi:peptidoglycan/LPS O-acetylase OafA/YrhL